MTMRTRRGFGFKEYALRYWHGRLVLILFLLLFEGGIYVTGGLLYSACFIRQSCRLERVLFFGLYWIELGGAYRVVWAVFYGERGGLEG